jgi:catechol 2,3-dioxygenase-like lactoylglutathione lyase family enzyme
MKFTHSCIITENIKQLSLFYRDVLQIEPQVYGENYAEFPTDCGTLSLFDAATHERLAPGSIRSAANMSVILEFQVDDVDREYERLQQMEIEWVRLPTTESWGNRTIYFRDPEGNLVEFFCDVSGKE